MIAFANLPSDVYVDIAWLLSIIYTTVCLQSTNLSKDRMVKETLRLLLSDSEYGMNAA
jgi:hypothetical protein